MLFTNKNLSSIVNQILVEKCGPIALEEQKKLGEVSPFTKPDGSIVTPGDIAVQEAFRKAILEETPQFGVMFEESFEGGKHKTGYIRTGLISTAYWVLDSIDGTHKFASKAKSGWNISASLVEQTKKGYLDPLLGSVYSPGTGRLIYTDGKKSFKKEGLGEGFEKEKRLILRYHRKIALEEGLFAVTFPAQAEKFLGPELTPVMPGGFVEKAIGVIEGRYLGTVTQSCPWDIAACQAIGRHLCVGFYDLGSGKAVDNFNMKDFIWEGNSRGRLKRPYLFCHEENKDFLLERMILPGKSKKA